MAGVSPNTNGADTTITPPTAPTSYIARAYGGGAGGYEANVNPPYRGNPGGSGGGGYSNSSASSNQPTHHPGGSGVSGQGYPGGGNTFYYPGTGWGQVSGGGGGAGGAGQRASADGSSGPSSSNWYAGDGGPGIAVPEFPLSVIFAPGVIPSTVIPADTLNRHNGYYAGGGGGAASPPGNIIEAMVVREEEELVQVLKILLIQLIHLHQGILPTLTTHRMVLSYLAVEVVVEEVLLHHTMLVMAVRVSL